MGLQAVGADTGQLRTHPRVCLEAEEASERHLEACKKPGLVGLADQGAGSGLAAT